MRVVRLPLGLVALVAAAHALGAAAPPPVLDVLLTPHSSGDAVDYVAVRMRIAEPRVAAAGTLVRMPLLIVSIPTARYDGQALQARDAAGPVVLTQTDEPPTPTGTYRRWKAARATQGDVVLDFRAPPRVVSAQTRTGPLFDLRAEAGGVSGAGISFLPIPDTTFPYRLHVHWDLAGLPAGSSGVWSLGEGDAHTIAPAETLQFTYYAAGPLKRFPATGSSAFSMYWLSPPAFDPVAVAARIQKLYAYMAQFFHDVGSSYRVFIRKNPHKAGGGTALAKSFMFGWSDASAPTVENLQGLLAHEMTHNWPAMQGEHGATAWYSEGTAEYYSILLSYRAGVLTPAQFLSAVNERAFTYYTNPLRNLTNDEAAKRFWSEWSAQTVPYGRGFMYLASVDAKIRAHSAGKRSLDDLVRTLYEREQKQQSYGIDDWLRLVSAELGPAAKEDYAAMVAGRTQIPADNSFAPCFKPEKHADRPFALGFDASSLSGEHRVIHGLTPGSPAAQAGLRDGDEVVESSDLEAQKSATALLDLKVRRGGKEVQVKYLPRGEPLASYHWVRDASVADSACKL